jgi:tetratricopeptide (TPR) repeat protein
LEKSKINISVLFVLFLGVVFWSSAQTHQECTEALKAFEEGKYQKAISILESQEITSFSCTDLLADSYHKNGDFENAIKWYTKAEKISNSSYLLYVKRARAYLTSNWPEKALADLKKAEKLFNKDEEIYFFMGLAYEAQGVMSKAEKSYKKSLEINPNFDLAAFNYAAKLAEKKKTTEALEILEKLNIENEEYAQTFNFNLGLLNFEAGEDNAAIIHLSKAINAPGEATYLAYLYRGLAKLNIADYDGACEDLKKATESPTEDLSKHYNKNCVGKSAEKVKKNMREHQYISF